jgi:hypothetical protein
MSFSKRAYNFVAIVVATAVAAPGCYDPLGRRFHVGLKASF